MSFKEIWSEFKDTTREQMRSAWFGIKQVCKASFEVLKNSIIALFTGIYNWLLDTITGTGKIIVALFNFIFSALGKALTTSLKYILDKLVDWVVKW